MGEMKVTVTVDGEPVEFESRQAYEATAKTILGVWDELSELRRIVPEALRDDYDRAMRGLQDVRSVADFTARRAAYILGTVPEATEEWALKKAEENARERPVPRRVQ